MVIPPQVISLIGNLAGEATGQAAEKIAEKYGEEMLRWAWEIAVDKADVVIDLAGDQAVELANAAVASATSKFTEVTGLTAAGIVGQFSGEATSQAVAKALAWFPDVDLAMLGAKVRETAGKGSEQLRDLTDEQVGAMAVLLSRTKD